MSKIQCIRTIRIAERPNLIWVEIETDEGLIGLGESRFAAPRRSRRCIHEPGRALADRPRFPADRGDLAPPDDALSRLRTAPAPRSGRPAPSTSRCGTWPASATASRCTRRWAAPARTEIRAYNTCAGYSLQQRHGRRAPPGGATSAPRDGAAGPYDDQIAFMRDAGALAESLLSEGYTAMKIWPLDIQAAASGGQMITLSELKAGLEPFRRIRAAVGDRIEVMGELHSLWSSPGRDPHLPGAGGSRHLLGRGPDRQDGRLQGAGRSAPADPGADLRQRDAGRRRLVPPAAGSRARSISSCSTSPGAVG